MTNFDGTSITYDSIGNPQNYYSNTFDWDLGWVGRQLTSAVSSLGDYELSFVYNDEGVRTSKLVNGVEHVYTVNGTQILSEAWGNNLIVYFYDDTGSPIGYAYRTTSMTEGEFYYYVYEKNLQGDVVAIYNTSGTKLVAYKYDAWGNVTYTNYNVAGSNVGAYYNSIRYRGYYYDTETGLYYLNSRYYDPNTGRFISADGYLNANGDIIGFNMFAYCSNNPVNRYDPTGHFWDYIFDVAFIVWGVMDVINDPSDWKNWTSLAIDVVFAVVPFIPSGVGQTVKVGNKIDNALDVASAINKIDNISEATKVTMIGRNMNRVKDTANLIGKADNLYDVWRGYDKVSSISKPLANAMSAVHNGGWLFGKFRQGYTVIDIGLTTMHKGRGLWYGTERLVMGMWRTRNIWKFPINYYS